MSHIAHQQRIANSTLGTPAVIGRVNRRLMLAVLNEALQTYAAGLTSNSATRRCDAHKAETWILSDAADWPFAFVNVCTVLGVDPDYIRGRMRRLRLSLFRAEGPAH